VEVDGSEFLDGDRRERVRVRLQAWLDAEIRRDFALLFAAEAAGAANPALRGDLHRLVEGMGIAAPATELPEPAHAALRRVGVEAGRFALFMPRLTKPAARSRRALLWALAHRVALPELPPAAAVSLPEAAAAAWPDGFAAAMGYVSCGPVLLRLDVAEKVAAALHASLAGGATALPVGLLPRLSIKAAALPAVLRAFGIRLLPASVLPGDQAGPPNPPMMSARPPRAVRGVLVPAPAGAFAKLAALRVARD
jgi:ATP-dependent RNA helicase SUPV3L1/SUV3